MKLLPCIISILTVALCCRGDVAYWQELYTKRGRDEFVKQIRSVVNTTQYHDPLQSITVQKYMQKLNLNKHKKMYPVVLITALMGAQLEAKLDRKTVAHWYCCKKSDWYLMWVDIEHFIPFVDRCWADNMKLKYDPKTHIYSPAAEGVQVRVRNGTDNVRFIDPYFGPLHDYTLEYNSIVKALLKTGYTKDKNIIAAPYDWRVGADSYYLSNGIFQHLKNLIEQAYKNNSNTPVVCVAESLGNPVFTLFLNTYVKQEWKDKYIKSYISLSGVFAGAGTAINAVITPDLDGLPPLIDPNLVRSLARSFGSIVWLFPNAKLWKKYVFISTDKKNYTASDFGTLLQKLKLKNVYDMWKNNKDLMTLTAPNVTVYCWHGIGIKTANSFHYRHNNFKKSPVTTTVDGDGVVPLPSLKVCEHWKDQQNKPVSSKSLPGVSHAGILSNKEVIMDILSIATGTKPSYP